MSDTSTPKKGRCLGKEVEGRLAELDLNLVRALIGKPTDRGMKFRTVLGIGLIDTGLVDNAKMAIKISEYVADVLREYELTAIVPMKAESKNPETTTAHGNADSILCEVLKAIGMDDLIEAYDKVDKWYE